MFSQNQIKHDTYQSNVIWELKKIREVLVLV